MAAIRSEDRDSIGQAVALAPAPGEKLAASAVRFATELPGDLASATLVVSRTPFEPKDWKAIPEGQGLHRADITSGLATDVGGRIRT